MVSGDPIQVVLTYDGVAGTLTEIFGHDYRGHSELLVRGQLPGGAEWRHLGDMSDLPPPRAADRDANHFQFPVWQCSAEPDQFEHQHCGHDQFYTRFRHAATLGGLTLAGS